MDEGYFWDSEENLTKMDDNDLFKSIVVGDDEDLFKINAIVADYFSSFRV